MKLEQIVVGPFQANCFVVWDESTRDAAVIDPGDDFKRIRELCEKEKLQVRFAIHTHAHLDHIAATSELKAWAPAVKLVLHREDDWLYRNLPMQGRMFGLDYGVPPSIDQFVQEGDTITIGGITLKVIHTPGHSPGGICLYAGQQMTGEAPALFSGDTLFQHSIGRTDLWGGDADELLRSIREKLLVLDEAARVYTGHGPATSIGVEKRENPFLIA